MLPIEFNGKKLRIAQDLNKKILEIIAYKLMKRNDDGIYMQPDDNTVAAYINRLAEKREIKHYRLIGETDEIYLFDSETIVSDLEILEVQRNIVPEIIKIQCYDEKIDENDSIPIEISRIDQLFKLPNTLFNSGTCIYFLCYNNKVVYVGQAENVHARLIEHMKNKEFDSVFYLRVPANKINKYECALISYLKPIYNIKVDKTNKYNSIAESILNN